MTLHKKGRNRGSQKRAACVTTCPTGARLFGDFDDPNSAISKLVNSGATTVFKKEEGTKPKVFYILPMRKR